MVIGQKKLLTVRAQSAASGMLSWCTSLGVDAAILFSMRSMFTARLGGSRFISDSLSALRKRFR